MSKSSKFDRMRRAAREIEVENLKRSGITLAHVTEQRQQDERARRDGRMQRAMQAAKAAGQYITNWRAYLEKEAENE